MEIPPTPPLVHGSFWGCVCLCVFYYTTLNSSKALHQTMLTAVLKVPVLFFDTNPVGRVLNRFSTDMAFLDEMLPLTFLFAAQIVLFCLSAVLLTAILIPSVLLLVFPLFGVFLFIGKYSVTTTRELKRLEALNRSPVLSHFADTVEGLVTIRSNQSKDMFLEDFYRYGITKERPRSARMKTKLKQTHPVLNPPPPPPPHPSHNIIQKSDPRPPCPGNAKPLYSFFAALQKLAGWGVPITLGLQRFLALGELRPKSRWFRLELRFYVPLESMRQQVGFDIFFRANPKPFIKCSAARNYTILLHCKVLGWELPSRMKLGRLRFH